MSDLSHKVVIFAKLWVVNLTGLPLYYNRSPVLGMNCVFCAIYLLLASTNLDVNQLISDPVTSYRNAVLPTYYPDAQNTRNVLYQDQEKLCFSPGMLSFSLAGLLTVRWSQLERRVGRVRDYSVPYSASAHPFEGDQHQVLFCRGTTRRPAAPGNLIADCIPCSLAVLAYEHCAHLPSLFPVQQHEAPTVIQAALQGQSGRQVQRGRDPSADQNPTAFLRRAGMNRCAFLSSLTVARSL